MLSPFSPAVLGNETEYVPGDEVLKRMTPRDGRRVLRTMGRVGVGWEGDDQFVGERIQVWVDQVVVRGGARGGWISIAYANATPRVEQRSGLFSGSRSVVFVGSSQNFRDRFLYYSSLEGYESAKKIADALFVLKRSMERYLGPNADAEFDEVVKQFRAADPKPQLTEDLRRYIVQASAAVQEKDLQDASDLFYEIVQLAPWYPEGHFNFAMVLGETLDFRIAIREMKRYLALFPEAPNARMAQDKIYEWERKISK